MRIRSYIICCGFVALQLCADSTTWNGNLNSDWTTITNWTSIVPNSTTAATFPAVSNTSINVAATNSPVATLNFTGGGYTISASGGGSLNLFTSINVGSGVSSAPLISCPIVFQASSPVAITLNNPLTISGTISGPSSAGLTISGAQTVTFSTSVGNTYSGPTVINGATLLVGDLNGFPINSIISANGSGIFDLGGFSGSVASINGDGEVNLESGTLTLTAASGTFAGNITDGGGGGSLTINAAGTLTLNPTSLSSDYSGTTSLSGGGQLTAGSAGAFSPNSLVSIGSGGTLSLGQYSNTILNLTGAIGGIVNLGTDSTQSLTFGDGTLQTFGGKITGSGGIVYTGTVAFTLSGNLNDYSGLTAVNGGSWVASGQNNVFSQNSVIQLASGTTLNLAGFNNTIANLSGVSGSSVTLGGATLSILNGAPETFSGTITGGVGSGLTMNGTANLTLTLPLSIPTLTVNSGTLNLNGSNVVTTLSGSGGAISIGSSGLLTATTGSNSSVISGQGGLTVPTGGTLTLLGVNTYFGDTTLQGSANLTASSLSPNSGYLALSTSTLDLDNQSSQALNIGGSGTTGTINLGSGTLSLEGAFGTFFGYITGTGGLTIIEPGELILDPTGTASDYSGQTLLGNLGTLAAGKLNAFSQDSTVYVQDKGHLNLNGYDNTIQNLKGDSGGVVALGENQLTFGGDDASQTFSGQITSTGSPTLSLTKNGSGTFTLGGTSNNYTGTTTVNSNANPPGKFQAGIAGAFSPFSAIQLNNRAQLNLNSFNNTIQNLNDDGNGNTQVTLGSGTLTIDGETLGSTGSFSGQIVDAGLGGGLVLTDTVTLTLGGASNSYIGGTLVTNTSFLSAGVANSFAPLSAVNVTVNGGLQLNGLNNTIGSLSGDSTAQVNMGGAGGILIVGDSSNTSFHGSIYASASGTNYGLTKQGSGTLTLTGEGEYGVSYGGETLIKNGSLQAAAGTQTYADNALSSTSAVRITPSEVSATLDISPAVTGGVNYTILSLASGSASSFVQLGANTLTFGDGNPQTFAGHIQGGTGGIIKQGSGVFTLSGNGLNAYSGSTVISAGSIAAGNPNAFSLTSAVSVASGATLALAGYTNEIANLSGAGTVSLNIASNSNTLTLGRDNNPSIFSGGITGTAPNETGGIIKVGSGTLTLTGVGLNTYSGNTTINAGVIKAGNSGVFSVASEVVVNGGSLNLNSNDNTIANLSGTGGSVIIGVAVLTFGNSNSTEYSGSISGVPNFTIYGGITKNGTGTFKLSGTNNTYGGVTTLSTGTWQAGAVNSFSKNSTVDLSPGTILDLNAFSNEIGNLSGTGGTVNLNGGQLTVGYNSLYDTSYAGTITESGGLVKVGTRTLTLTALNDYTGGTQINGGAISISSNDQLGNLADALTLNNGTLITTTGLVNTSRPIMLSNTGTIDTQEALIASGNISGNGNLIKKGLNTLTVGDATYLGTTTINAGTLQAGAAGAFSPTSEVTIASGATLDLQNNNNTIGNLNGAGSVTLGSGNLIVGDENPGLFSGDISGSGALQKNGTGLLNLTGTNTISGGITVSAGTLSINEPGTTTSNPFVVSSGAILKGQGTIIGNVTCSGTTAPGNSIETLTVNGNYNALTGSNFEVEASPILADNLTTSGITQIDSGATITVIPYTGSYNSHTPYQVITATGGLNGTFTNVVCTLSKATVELEYLPNALILYLTVKSFNDVAIGWNAKNVARVLDVILLEDLPAWSDTLDNLFSLPESEFNVALNEIVPAQLKGLSIIQQNNAVRVQNGIALRFQNLLDKMTCPSLKGCKVKKSPMYVWVDGFNSKLRQPSNFIDTNPQVGYHSNTGGGSIGIDINFLKTGYVGVMGAGTYSDVQWVNGQGHGHINSGYLGIYGSAISEKKFLNLSLLGSVNKYGAARNIIYLGENETASSNHKGLQLLSHLDFGINCDCKWFTIRPFESLEYIIQHENGFEEQGANVFDLNIQKTNPQIVRNELGVNFTRCFNLSKKSQLLADMKLSWVSENRLKGTLFTSSFVEFPDMTFQTEGYYPNRNFFSPGAALTANFANDTVYITVTYDAEIGHHYLDQRTGAQFGFRF